MCSPIVHVYNVLSWMAQLARRAMLTASSSECFASPVTLVRHGMRQCPESAPKNGLVFVMGSTWDPQFLETFH